MSLKELKCSQSHKGEADIIIHKILQQSKSSNFQYTSYSVQTNYLGMQSKYWKGPGLSPGCVTLCLGQVP